MALKVVGAGLGRTGTHSLKIALERLLGEPCYHMVEVFQHPEHVPSWRQAAEGNMPDWHALMEGYSSAVDWPASAFWPELAGAFPDALILLSVRDAEKWWESASQTIFNARPDEDNEAMGPWFGMVVALFNSRFTTEIKDKDACIAAFNAHNDEVKRTAPANRLLIWQASDGWEPICKALNLPIPEEPFPRTNSKEEFIARRKEELGT